MGRKPNISIQAFQSNTIYATCQTFKPRDKIYQRQQFKSSSILLENHKLGNPEYKVQKVKGKKSYTSDIEYTVVQVLCFGYSRYSDTRILFFFTQICM